MFLNLGFEKSEKIIDTHCHLDNKSYFNDLNEVLFNSFENNIDKIIIPAADIKDLPRAVELCETYEQLFFTVGTHPNECENYDEALLRKLIKHKKCVGVGECGLDYYYLKADDEGIKRRQKEVFVAQLELASEFDKPVIIHSREANADTFELVNLYKPKLVGGVFHCFNASELLLGLKEKFYLSEDDKIKVDASSKNDYRMFVPASKLKAFVKRFDKTVDREQVKNLKREFR